MLLLLSAVNQRILKKRRLLEQAMESHVVESGILDKKRVGQVVPTVVSEQLFLFFSTNGQEDFYSSSPGVVCCLLFIVVLLGE